LLFRPGWGSKGVIAKGRIPALRFEPLSWRQTPVGMFLHTSATRQRGKEKVRLQPEFPWGAASVAGMNRGAMGFDGQVREFLGIGPLRILLQFKSPSGVAATFSPRRCSRRNSLANVEPMPSLRDLAIVITERSRRLRAWLSNATAPPLRKTGRGISSLSNATVPPLRKTSSGISHLTLGQTWIGQTWIGQTWIGQTWIGQTWIGQTWIGQTWIGQTWVGKTPMHRLLTFARDQFAARRAGECLLPVAPPACVAARG
jgi:hypothetical protein